MGITSEMEAEITGRDGSKKSSFKGDDSSWSYAPLMMADDPEAIYICW